MSFYVVGESRLFPGRTEQYLDAIRQIVQILREVSNADTGISVQAVECRDVFSDPSLMAAVWLRER